MAKFLRKTKTPRLGGGSRETKLSSSLHHQLSSWWSSLLFSLQPFFCNKNFSISLLDLSKFLMKILLTSLLQDNYSKWVFYFLKKSVDNLKKFNSWAFMSLNGRKNKKYLKIFRKIFYLYCFLEKLHSNYFWLKINIKFFFYFFFDKYN